MGVNGTVFLGVLEGDRGAQKARGTKESQGEEEKGMREGTSEPAQGIPVC